MTATARSQIRAANAKEEALWLLERLVPGSAANNVPVALRVEGRLRRPALDDALAVLVDRHPALRTVYHADHAQLRRTECSPGTVRPRIEEIPAPTRSVDDNLTAFASRPFALDGTPLLRAGILTDGDGDILCLSVHHLIFDVASAAVLIEELTRVYTSTVTGTPLPEDLRDRVEPLTEAEPRVESLAFWREQLAGFHPDSSDLWCGHAEFAQPTLVGDCLTHTLPPDLRADIQRLRKDLRAPEAVILFAAYCLLLDGHGAGPDIVVGSPVNVRPRGAERAIGYHVNFLPLRVRVDRTTTVRDLVRAARDVFFNSLLYSDAPVDALTRDLPRSISARRAMMFRHVFNYLPATALGEFTVAGHPARTVLVENGYSKFDIEFFVMSGEDDLRVRIVFRPEILDRADVELMVERYEALLRALTTHTDRPIGEVVPWGARDHAVITAANDTAGPVTPPSVPEAIHAHVVRTPDAVAVVDGDRTVTYRALWESARATATLLTGHGVARGDVVAVATKRSAELAVSTLGIWLAGATYLPIDPEHPAQRVNHQLTDSGAGVLIADTNVPAPPGDRITTLPPPAIHIPAADAATADEPAPRVDPSACAYLIYTSGSTGVPKGTLIPHLALANVVTHFVSELDVGPGDGTVWMTTFAFDISALELFVPLFSGGRVVVAPDEARLSGRALAALIERNDAKVVQATPTTWRVVVDDVAEALAGRAVICGGEALPVPLAERLLATGCRIHHVYGPTETTIWSTSGALTGLPDGRVDIGRPLRNTRVMVMDPADRELPIGVIGEMCVAGTGVAVGYHDRAELTAQRFREHPAHGRYYRTGDLARWRPDGTLELLGRGDRQIKLRGNRIELGEIESVLLRHPDVQAVAVVVVGDPSADARLVAFVESTQAGLSLDSLWQRARTELSRAMVPQEFIVVDALPTNANEKVDYPALAALAATRTDDTGSPPPVEADDDELSAALLALMNELLERTDTTPDSNFFMSGGDSLRGALLGQQIEDRMGIHVPLADLFENPTPRGLAAWIRAADQP